MFTRQLDVSAGCPDAQNHGLKSFPVFWPLRQTEPTDQPPPVLHLTFLFLTSSPCRWFLWRNDPADLSAPTAPRRVPERPLTSTAVPFPGRAPLQMLLLLTDKDLDRPSSNELVPTVCR